VTKEEIRNYASDNDVVTLLAKLIICCATFDFIRKKIGYFNDIVLVFMGVSCGYSLLTKLEDLCVSWRKALRRVWCLPNTSHSYFLPILSQRLPLFYQICRRSINFIRSCLSNESSLVSTLFSTVEPSRVLVRM